MIQEKLVDLYARNSRVRDKLLAERDVVLTYALQVLQDAGVASQLAFKGGTCLRKMHFGASGRFSEDLDFTFHGDLPRDDVLQDLVAAFNGNHYGIVFAFDEYYITEEETSFGGDVLYRHDWNDTGRFRLQVSLREQPTLPVMPQRMQRQFYFDHLEFEPAPVPALEVVEMAAEKVRAAYQRAKVRDIYDLYRFAATPFDAQLLRRLVVLKLWQARDPFNPDTFFAKLRGGEYDWDDLRRLLRTDEQLEASAMLRVIEERFGFLRQPTELEQQVATDARSGWNQPLAGRLRSEIQARFVANR